MARYTGPLTDEQIAERLRLYYADDPRLYFQGRKFANMSRRNEAERVWNHQQAVQEYLAKGGQITHVEPGVSVGESKTKYLGHKNNFGNRPPAEKISSGDAKFDMYANALPQPLRKWAAATEQDVRALYKEYRSLGKQGMVDKYLPAVQEWEKANG